MTFTATTTTHPARRSLLGLVLAGVLALVLLAAASPANAASGPPFGNLDNAGGQIWSGEITGWAVDPDAAFAAIDVRLDLYDDGYLCAPWGGCSRYSFLISSQTQTANLASGGVPPFPYSFSGRNFGFEFLLPWGAADKACVTAINVGAGSDTSLGCVTLKWIDYDPLTWS
jgi:hypothetical protein